jgi:hypothetical protein
VSETFYRAGYYAKKRDIETLRGWIDEAISKPSMSLELRLRGAEVSVASHKAEGGYYATLEDPLPKQVREAVDRICASRTVPEDEYERDIDESPEHETEVER